MPWLLRNFLDFCADVFLHACMRPSVERSVSGESKPLQPSGMDTPGRQSPPQDFQQGFGIGLGIAIAWTSTASLVGFIVAWMKDAMNWAPYRSP